MSKVSNVFLAGLVSVGLLGATTSYAAVTDSANYNDNDMATTGMSPPGNHAGKFGHKAAPLSSADTSAGTSAMGPASSTSETAMPKVQDPATSTVNK